MSMKHGYQIVYISQGLLSCLSTFGHRNSTIGSCESKSGNRFSTDV